jgi:ABC-2 type transport system ATP-binding protein
MEDFVIKTENLTKVYGHLFWKKKEASLEKLNLQIPRGSVFGFLGPNGAGKTTTIRLLMDLIKPSEGQAWVLGQPADNVKVKQLIGYLPDGPSFSTYLKAYEFLNICAKLLKIPSSERKKRIYEVLEIVKMTEHAHSKLGGFSRGMIQRIGIAQSILNKPELLILDEPLVGLDPHGRQELKDIINEQKKAGTNVFFCSHILSDVEKICDHVGILSRGKMLCCGALTDLLSETGYRLVIKAGHDDIMQKFMPEASSSSKLSDGGWELVFKENVAVKKSIDELKKEKPDAITYHPSKENLEDFFFRQIASTDKRI